MNTESVLAGLIIVNGIMNLVIIYYVAPLYALKGRMCMVVDTLRSHDERIQSMEARL